MSRLATSSTTRVASMLRRSALPAITVTSAIIAVGSVAWAASLPNNSVGTAQLKANAVTGAKLRPNAVTTTDIAANAVTGAKVKESTLGKVPSATTADSATSATTAATATAATTAVSASTAASVDNATTFSKRVAATPVATFNDANLEATADTVLYTQGTLSIRADCVSEGGNVHGVVQAHTTTDGAAFYAFGAGPRMIADGSQYLNAATLPLQRYMVLTSVAGNTAAMGMPASFVAIAADGGAIAGVVSAVVKQGTLPISPGNGFMGTGNSCLFAGTVGRAPLS